MSTHTNAMPAEKYAEQLLREALARGGTPDLRDIADSSALSVREVAAIRDRMLSGRREASAPSSVRPSTAPAEDWRRGLSHPVARIRRKATKIDEQIAALLADLHAEAERDILRAKERQLLGELDKVRAQLRGTAPGPTSETGTCDQCGKAFTTAHGLAVHRRRVHT